MSIAHELSCEIESAILMRKEETRRLEELKEVVLRVHYVFTRQGGTRFEPGPL